MQTPLKAEMVLKSHVSILVIAFENQVGGREVKRGGAVASHQQQDFHNSILSQLQGQRTALVFKFFFCKMSGLQ